MVASIALFLAAIVFGLGFGLAGGLTAAADRANSKEATRMAARVRLLAAIVARNNETTFFMRMGCSVRVPSNYNTASLLAQPISELNNHGIVRARAVQFL